MSITTPSASRSGRRKVASTTYVAPCSRRAGPNASPRRLWAIIMWSRTVTLNTGSPASAGLVGDCVADRRQAAVGQGGHHRRQVGEPGLAGQERVEDGVPGQVQRESQ